MLDTSTSFVACSGIGLFSPRDADRGTENAGDIKKVENASVWMRWNHSNDTAI